MEATTQSSISATEAPDKSSKNPPEYHASKQIVEEGYDQMAPRYLDWTTSHSSPRLRYLHKLLDLLPQKSNVLELGCMLFSKQDFRLVRMSAVVRLLTLLLCIASAVLSLWGVLTTEINQTIQH